MYIRISGCFKKLYEEKKVLKNIDLPPEKTEERFISKLILSGIHQFRDDKKGKKKKSSSSVSVQRETTMEVEIVSSEP